MGFETTAGKILTLEASSIRRPQRLYALRDRIAAAMAERLKDALARGDEIEWAGARLSRTQLRTSKLVLPIDSSVESRSDDERMRVFSRNNPDAMIVLATGTPNFFPDWKPSVRWRGSILRAKKCCARRQRF